jgi:flagellar basal-body rod protein FlgB
MSGRAFKNLFLEGKYMAIRFDEVLGVHADALRLRTERAKILASNLANESTPGYEARDIDFAASLQQLQGDEAGGGLSLDTGTPDLKYRVPNNPSQDGNTVELGVEQAQFSQNASDFEITTTFLAMQLRGLAKAIEGQ